MYIDPVTGVLYARPVHPPMGVTICRSTSVSVHVKYCVPLSLDEFESVFPGFAADTDQEMFPEYAVAELSVILYGYIAVAKSRHAVVPV